MFRSRWWLPGLVLLPVLAYANSLGNGFAWDDEYVLVRNTAVHDLTDLGSFFSDPTTGASDPAHLFYRPLRTTLYALWHALFGLSPLPYHLLNVLLHVVNTGLVFVVLGRLAGSRTLAFTVAALFGVHPLTSEAVANITGLTDVLFVCFLLLGLLIHLQRPSTLALRILRSLGVAGCFVLALLSKEMAIAFPLLLLVVDAARRQLARTPGDPGAAQPGGTLTAAMHHGLVWLTAVAFVALRTHLVGSLGQSGNYPGGTLARTMAMQLEVLATYLRLAVFPVGLSVRHSIAIPTSYFDPSIWISGAVVLLLLLSAILTWRRRPLMSLGIAWFFVALGPSMNLIPVQGPVLGERFCYLALPGLLLAGAEALRWLWGTRSESTPAQRAAALLAAAGLLAAATAVRNRDWKDNLTLFEAAVKVAPDSNAIRVNLVREYEQRGRIADARAQWEAARENTLRNRDLYKRLGEAQLDRGDRAEARIWFERAARMDPRDPEVQARLGELAADP